MSTIYIHWPYCITKCKYCSFNSVAITEAIDFRLLNSLYTKVILKFCSDFYNNELISSIYFGGGTPSILPAWFVSNILSTIHKNFNVSEIAEITLEANPLTIDHQKAMHFKKAGINRLSIGVQSLRDKDLLMLGRKHNSNDAIRCIFDMANIFDNISIDMIYNRPGQQLSDWVLELNESLLLPIQHISLYELIVEDGTELHNLISSGSLPSPRMGSEFIETTWEISENAGFHRYEVSNFAKQGFKGEHNLSYWKYEDYYGIGPGAHSRITSQTSKIAIEQIKNIDAWIRMTTDSMKFETTELSFTDVTNEKLIMGLRSEIGIDLSDISIDNNKVRSLLADSYIMLKGNMMVLTSEGLLKLNLIVAYLSDEKQ
jgi:oxygen-independent coproporphyrinogen-3 oxidase